MEKRWEVSGQHKPFISSLNNHIGVTMFADRNQDRLILKDTMFEVDHTHMSMLGRV